MGTRAAERLLGAAERNKPVGDAGLIDEFRAIRRKVVAAGGGNGLYEAVAE